VDITFVLPSRVSISTRFGRAFVDRGDVHVPDDELGGAEGELELLRNLKDVPLRVLEVAPVLAGLGAALDLCHLLHPSRQKLSYRCANVFDGKTYLAPTLAVLRKLALCQEFQ
jgi:hypothetical protein